MRTPAYSDLRPPPQPNAAMQASERRRLPTDMAPSLFAPLSFQNMPGKVKDSNFPGWAQSSRRFGRLQRKLKKSPTSSIPAIGRSAQQLQRASEGADPFRRTGKAKPIDRFLGEIAPGHRLTVVGKDMEAAGKGRERHHRPILAG